MSSGPSGSSGNSGNPTPPKAPAHKTTSTSKPSATKSASGQRPTSTTSGQKTTTTAQKTTSSTTSSGQKSTTPAVKPAAAKPTGAGAKLVPASAWDVRGLRVLVPDGKGGFEHVPPGTDVFDCTASIIGMALDLLEYRSSIIALRMHTTRVIDASQHIPQVRNIQDDDIEPTIRRYLATIRSSFPHVVVTDKYGMTTMNGRTNKKEWKEGADPKTATVIELSAMLVGRLATAYKALQTGNSASQMRRFRNLHLRLSLTMAHELVHVYNLYLQGGQHSHTPPTVTYGPYGDDRVGESGRYWEYWTLGGWVDMRADANGLETIALRDSHGQKAWPLKPEAIDGLLARDFDKVLQRGTPLNDEEHPKGKFVDKITPLQWKDRYTDVFPRPAAPVKGAAPPQPEFTAKQVAVLTGADMMKTPRFNICGIDLQSFGVDPRTKLRLAA